MNRIEFDSNEEWYFSWYLDELEDNGFISHWEIYTKSFELTDGLVHWHIKPMVRVQDKKIMQTILNPSTYNPDVKIEWTEKAVGIFVDVLKPSRYKLKSPYLCDENLISIIEIKGGFDNNNMTRLAINNIKFVYEKFGIYINMVKVPQIFNKTFTPNRYLLTDKSMVGRKIKYKNILTLKDFTTK